MVALPALYHGRVALVLIKHTCPFADALQNRNNRCTLLRKRVFDPRRYLVIRSARNKASCDKPFSVEASTASVMLPISRRSSLYRSVLSAASTQMMREFHFPRAAPFRIPVDSGCPFLLVF